MPADPPAFERFAEQLARRLAGGGLHPAHLLARVRSAVLAGVRDGVMANEVRVLFHPDDYAAYRPGLREVRQAILEELDRIEAENGFRRIGRSTASILSSNGAAKLAPHIEAHFVHTEHRIALPRAGETRRLRPLRGWDVVIDDGVSVPIGFVPFAIGRAADNDLVLPGASVSRRHAEIVDDGGGLAIEDLGSRNGILVHGQRVQHAPLDDGDEVTIGDVRLRVEHTA